MYLKSFPQPKAMQSSVCSVRVICCTTATANTTTSVSTVWWRISWKPCITASPTCTIILSWNVQTSCSFSFVSSLAQKKHRGLLLSTGPLVSVSPLLLRANHSHLPQTSASLCTFQFSSSKLQRTGFMTLCIQFFKSWLDTISTIKLCQIYFDWHRVQVTKLDDGNCYGFIACVSWQYQRFFAIKLTKTHLVQSVACADEDETLAIISGNIQLD